MTRTNDKREWVCQGWVPSTCCTSKHRRKRGDALLVVAANRAEAREEYLRRRPDMRGYSISASPYECPESAR
jgi:hypothetical protein